jgi:hypothetical protein
MMPDARRYGDRPALPAGHRSIFGAPLAWTDAMDDRNQGGLTGATGSLTPSDPDDEFVPAETREMNDPRASRRINAETDRPGEDRGEGQADPGEPPVINDSKPQPMLGGDERHDPEAEHF